MEKVAWLGTGLLGSAFVEALCKRDANVVAWNRTHARALPLERFGARVEADVRSAVSGAERIHIVVNDDAAVDDVLERIDGALAPGAVVIDHSTVAPAPTAARFERMQARGHAFLHAPVFMSPAAARMAQGLMLVCGSLDTYERVRAQLQAMTGEVTYVGAEPGRAAALKLCGNAMGSFLVAGLADVFALGRGAGIAPDETFALLTKMRLGALAERLGSKMLSDDDTPNVELRTARKDMRMMLDTGSIGGVSLHVLPAIAARMDALIASGKGDADLTVLGSASAER